eukprot:1157380-Pelagomonas_calceolata.AAC.14
MARYADPCSQGIWMMKACLLLCLNYQGDLALQRHQILTHRDLTQQPEVSICISNKASHLEFWQPILAAEAFTLCHRLHHQIMANRGAPSSADRKAGQLIKLHRFIV